MNDWIKCTDKLPKNEQEVLITLKGEALCRGGYDTDNKVVEAMFVNNPFFDGSWYPFFSVWGDDENRHHIEDVLAWMPLPKPYLSQKENTDENKDH